MGRYIFAVFAVFSFSGCSILNRVDLCLSVLIRRISSSR